MPNSEFTSWMNRCVPTAPVEYDGAKSLSESPCHEETVAGASCSGGTGWESTEAAADRTRPPNSAYPAAEPSSALRVSVRVAPVDGYLAEARDGREVLLD